MVCEGFLEPGGGGGFLPIGGGGPRREAEEFVRVVVLPRVFRRLATEGATAEVVCAGIAGGLLYGSGGAAAGGRGAVPPGAFGTEEREVSGSEEASPRFPADRKSVV